MTPEERAGEVMNQLSVWGPPHQRVKPIITAAIIADRQDRDREVMRMVGFSDTEVADLLKRLHSDYDRTVGVKPALVQDLVDVIDRLTALNRALMSDSEAYQAGFDAGVAEGRREVLAEVNATESL